MQVQFGRCRIVLVQGDITALEADAIVNAANKRLAGGGGVDGAIHRAGGPAIMQETQIRYPQGCPTGSAVVTKAGNLSAQWVFHAVGPVWNGGQDSEAELLKSVYVTCLQLAVENSCRSIVFPAISTGAYGYPRDLASQIAITTTRSFLLEHEQPAEVHFVLFDAGSYGAYARILEEMSE